MLDSVFLYSNKSCSVDSAVYSYNSGIFIEGLVILADIMRNTSTEALYVLTYPSCPYTELWFLLDCAVPLLPLQPIPYGRDWMASLLVCDLSVALFHDFIVVV